MGESVKQSLSALMDDEAEHFEVRRLLQQMSDEDAATWSRYHTVRASLRAELAAEPVDLSASVSEALRLEPAYSAKSKAGWMRPITSIAVAASVTAIVIFGAQRFDGGAATAALDNSVASLPAPAVTRTGVLEASYGAAQQRFVQPLDNADVIRLSDSLDYYIQQHHSMIRERESQWLTGWVPDGFKQVRHDLMPDSEVMLYSNGRQAISVSVEPVAMRRAQPGVVQIGGTLAFGKRIDDQFVTVVGDLPLMMADRIASSVTPAVR